MDVTLHTGPATEAVTDALVLPVFQDDVALPLGLQAIDAALDGVVAHLRELRDFAGELNQSTLIYPRGSVRATRVFLVGLGKRSDITPDRVARVAAAVAQRARQTGAQDLCFPVETAVGGFARSLVEGALLGLYRFASHATEREEPRKEITRLVLQLDGATNRQPAEAEMQLASHVAAGTIRARDLSNETPNYLPPAELAVVAQRIANDGGLRCDVLGPDRLRDEGFGALLGVAQGSGVEPRFIVLDHAPEAASQTLVLVGKGVTFDSGGLSIKTTKGMMDMKHDMSGAAAVLGTMQVVAALKPAMRVVGLVAACENMIGPLAQKPGDVVRAYDGTTIEVLNTDAEGRLVLADALGYAATLKPDAVIDLATLTGAVVTALGHHAAGVLGTDETLLTAIERAGVATHERVWRLPLWDDYDEALKSTVADIKNIGDGTAGTIAGAAFLKRFARGYPWAHLDIAGTAWEIKGVSYIPEGASGYGVRLLTELIRMWGRR